MVPQHFAEISLSDTLKVRVIGSGLIGTSIGLALKQAGCSLEMIDVDQKAQQLANKLVDGSDLKSIDLVVIAVDIVSNKSIIVKALNENSESIVIDVASVKSNLLQEVSELSDNAKNFVASHPMAGREVGGGHSARSDLFKGRAWIGIESQLTSTKAKQTLEFLVNNCGATLYWHSAREHDQIVAKISHLPQLISSAFGAVINDSNEADLNLAGQGLRDLLRLAGSDATLWSQLLITNSAPVLENLQVVIAKLQSIEKAIIDSNNDALRQFLVAGNNGLKKIPGKHGLVQRDYAFLSIVINDEAGQLAKIFNDCAKANVNIEDLSIEHSPGQLTGLITLAVSDKDASKLYEHLSSCGWDVFQVKSR
jgi:prephenate dehydrogenase